MSIGGAVGLAVGLVLLARDLNQQGTGKISPIIPATVLGAAVGLVIGLLHWATRAGRLREEDYAWRPLVPCSEGITPANSLRREYGRLLTLRN